MRTWRTKGITALVLLLPVVLCFGKGMTGSWTLIPLDILYGFVAPWSQHAPVPDLKVANPVLSDQVLQFEPWAEFARQELAAGRLPLWNPFVAGGVPFAANPQTTLFYPLSMPISLWLPDASPAIRAGLHVLLAAWFMHLFLLRLGVSRAGALLGGLSFSFSQFMMAWIGYPMGWTVAWLPAWFYFTERLCTEERAGRTGLLAAGVIALSALAGHPETTFHTAVFTLVYAMLRSAGIHGWTRFWKGPLRLGLAGVLGGAMAAVVLIPFWEYLHHSASFLARSCSAHEHYANPPGLLLGCFFPRIFGDPGLNVIPVNFNERASYAGLITALLALSAVFRREAWRGPWPVILALGGIGLVAGYDILGLHRWLGRIPGFSAAANHRLIFLTLFALSALGALGMTRLAASRSVLPWGIPLFLFLSVSSLGLVIPAASVVSCLRGIPGEVVRESLCIGFGLAGALLVGVILLHRSPRWLVPGVVLLCAADLVGFAWNLNPVLPAHWRNRVTPEILAIQKEKPVRLIGLNNAFTPASALPHRIRTLDSYEALGVACFQMITEPVLPIREDILSDPRLRLLGATHLYCRAPFEKAPADWVHSRCGKGHLYRIPGALPRAFIATKLIMVGGMAELETVLSHPGFNPEAREVLCAFPTRFVYAAPGIKHRKDRAEIIVDLPGRVEIEVELSGPGMLVLTDAFYPGWKVTVDDHPGFAIPVYGCVRGVSLTGSEKKVVFRYEPASFSWGLAVTLLGLALWSGGMFWTSRNRRRPIRRVEK